MYERKVHRMALIECEYCNEKISDKAKKCPKCGKKSKNIKKDKEELCPDCGNPLEKGIRCNNCGYEKKNMKTNKKNVVVICSLVFVVALCIIVGLVISSNIQKRKSDERVAAVRGVISAISEKSIPSQDEYDNASESYAALNDDEKKRVGDVHILEKYKDADLSQLNALNTKIVSLADDVKFSELLALEDEYNKLSDIEKELIDITSIAKKKELSDEEKAALAVAKNVRSVMLSKNDFKVNELYVKNDLNKMNFYFVKIKYTGTNSFGGSIDRTSFFPVDDEYKDPFFGLAAITGMDEYLDSVTNYNQYEDCKKKEQKVDVEKIRYYLDRE